MSLNDVQIRLVCDVPPLVFPSSLPDQRPKHQRPRRKNAPPAPWAKHRTSRVAQTTPHIPAAPQPEWVTNSLTDLGLVPAWQIGLSRHASIACYTIIVLITAHLLRCLCSVMLSWYRVSVKCNGLGWVTSSSASLKQSLMFFSAPSFIQSLCFHHAFECNILHKWMVSEKFINQTPYLRLSKD